MSTPRFVFGFTIALLCFQAAANGQQEESSPSSETATTQPLTYEANWDSIAQSYKVPEWYQDAKFGIWPHWGVYSVPAFGGGGPAEWYGRYMHCVEKGPDVRPKKNDPTTILNRFYDSRGLKVAKHHLETYGGPEKFGYHDFVDQWKAEKFDADEWAQMTVDSGAKFFCMMAQHHDSFSLYDSEHTQWDSVDKGPKRDLCQEIKDAVKKRGLKFGVSNHMAWNSSFFAYYHNNGHAKRPGQEKYRDLYSSGVQDSAYLDRWWKRTTEAVDKLQPDLYYFDWGWHGKPFTDAKYHQRFASYFYNKAIEQGKGVDGGPGVVMCSKFRDDPPNCVIRDLERGRMSNIQTNVWQTDTSISVHSWGYSADDEYFSVDYLVDQLIDIVSKNGVLMLNFGPKADGTVAAEYKERLLGMGSWLKVCGDAIYATRPFHIYGEKPNKEELAAGATEIRYTRSKDNSILYAIALAWPGEKFTLSKLKQDKFQTASIKSIRLLGTNDSLSWNQDKTGIHVTMPIRPDYEFAFPIAIQFDGEIPKLAR